MLTGTFQQPASDKLRAARTRSNVITLGDVTHTEITGIMSPNLLINLDLRSTSERTPPGPDLSTLDKAAEDIASVSSRAPLGPIRDASKAGVSFSVSLSPAITEYLSTLGCWMSSGQRPRGGVARVTPGAANVAGVTAAAQTRRTDHGVLCGVSAGATPRLPLVDSGDGDGEAIERSTAELPNIRLCGGSLRDFASVCGDDSGPAGDVSVGHEHCVIHWWNSQVVSPNGSLLLQTNRQSCIVNRTSGQCAPPQCYQFVTRTGRGPTSSLRCAQDLHYLCGSRLTPWTMYGDRGSYNLTIARVGDNGVCALARLAVPAGVMLLSRWLLQLPQSLQGLSQETPGRMQPLNPRNPRNPRNQAGNLAGAVQAAAVTESNTATIYDEDVAARVGLCGAATPTTAVCPRSSATSLSLPASRCSEYSSPCSQDVDETIDLASLASDKLYHVATHCCRASILSVARLKAAPSASKEWTTKESLRQLVAALLSDPIHRLPSNLRNIVEPVPWRGTINSPRAGNRPSVTAGHVCSDRGLSAKQPDALLPPEDSKGLRTGVLVVSINAKCESVAGWEAFLETSSALKGSQAESAGRWDMDCSTTATQNTDTETPFFASTVEISEIGDAHGAVWAGEDADYLSSRLNGYGSDVAMDGWSVDKDPTTWVPLRHRYGIVSVNVSDGEPRMEVADCHKTRRVGEDADPVPDVSAGHYRSELDLDAAIVESDPHKWTPLRARYAVTPQNKASVGLLHTPGGRVRLLALAFERRIAELQSSSLPRHQAFVKSPRDHGCVSPGGTGSAGRVFSPVRLFR
ncbi:hypothetical protein Vafri_3800 [Volvox africanus]|uniref:Uncharacterized protein n=1 Tax=Volvox africanus TaxID=51714 RepID=A0A8J4ASZ5_9CHLO|nr:hypothetical protein Vafri_3800 [Volvox africanus]